MFRIKIIFSSALFLIFMACAPQKKIFFFDQPVPLQVYTPAASQESFDHPPLYIPTGNRKTIFVYSPNFTIAVPNAMDMTGRSGDLQKSLADILCTELVNYQGKRRIKLLDRGTLVNLDTKFIIDAIYNQKLVSSDQKESKEIDKSKKQETTLPNSSSSIPEKKEDNSDKIQLKLEEETKRLKKYLENADGILLLYITSRVGTENGYFEVDYRIVNNKGIQKDIVLLAGSAKVQYRANTEKQIEYQRDGVIKIATNIYDNMTIKYDTSGKMEMDIQVIKCDLPFIVINIGQDNKLIEGMIGYVVERDSGVAKMSSKDEEKDKNINPENMASYYHYSYIAEFIVTDVFNKTSNAVLINPESDWDVRVDDLVVIK